MTQHLNINSLAFLLALAPVSVTLAKTYYVAPEGNDNAQGSGWSTAWRTLQHAANQLAPGDTLKIRSGAYSSFRVKRSGEENHPIIIQGEDGAAYPTITGSTHTTNWSKTGELKTWFTYTASKPTIVLKDNKPIKKASSRKLEDGAWFWENNKLLVKSDTPPARHHIERASKGGGINIRQQSWIIIKNIQCRLGLSACITLDNSHHVTIENVQSKWMWRGINITNGSNNNIIKNCHFTENREGVYILAGSNHNTIANCKITYNGNLPLWRNSDRAGIAIGERGINMHNIVENSEIAFNGGPNSDPGLIAYQAPFTIFRNNHVHSNFGSGIFITIGSDNSIVTGNIVENNGKQATQSGIKGIAGLSVRRSNHVLVTRNTVRNNYVSPDSPWKGKDTGSKGGLDIRALPNDKVDDITVSDNTVYGTIGGPDYYISPHTKVIKR